MKTLTVEYQLSGSTALHRVKCNVNDHGQVFWESHSSLVDGEWIRANDTTRGAMVFHTRTVNAFAVLGAQRNARVVRVTL